MNQLIQTLKQQLTINQISHQYQEKCLDLCTVVSSLQVTYKNAFNTVMEKWCQQIVQYTLKMPTHQQQSHQQLVKLKEKTLDQSGKVLGIIENMQLHYFTITKGILGTCMRARNSNSLTQGQSLFKKRSLSASSRPRRNSSKHSFFAKAKKVGENDTTQTFFTKTDSTHNAFAKTQNCFVASKQQKIKKTKLKQKNLFEYKPSTTSPSDFMINYINRHPVDTSHVNEATCKSFLGNKSVFGEKNDNTKEKMRQDYNKMMGSFQDKITAKIDALMDRYNHIQQQITVSQVNQPRLISNQTKQNTNAIQQLKTIERPLTKDFSYNTKGIMASLSSPLLMPPVFRQMRDISVNQSKLQATPVKENQVVSYFQSKTAQTGGQISQGRKQTVKCVNQQAKIVRKKKTDQVDSAISQIKLKNNEQKENVTELREDRVVSMAQFEAVSQQNNYIKQTLCCFHSITCRLKLPISKKLLGVLKKKYQHYATSTGLSLSAQIADWEDQPLNNQGQLTQIMAKMEKLLDLKCQAEKKQKLVEYIACFLRCFLSFTQGGVVKRQLGGEDALRQQIKQAAKLAN